MIAGRLGDLAVRDFRQEIRDRMRRALDMIEKRAAAEPDVLSYAMFDESWLTLPDKYIGFDALAARLAAIMAEKIPVEPMPGDGLSFAASVPKKGFPYWVMHH